MLQLDIGKVSKSLLCAHEDPPVDLGAPDPPQPALKFNINNVPPLLPYAPILSVG